MLKGEAGPGAVGVPPARGRPPQAAARRAGLEFVEKLLTKLTSADTTVRNAEHASRRARRIAGRTGYWLALLVVLVVVAAV